MSCVQRLESELQRLHVTEMSSDVLVLARQVVDAHSLRALDAIQLGTALRLSELDTFAQVTLVAADKKLLQAAQASGLRIINPEISGIS